MHIPFCLTRCGYCDFNAYAGLDELKPRVPAGAAHRGGARGAGRGTAAPFVSVFLGGGTPTTMAPADLRALLAHLRDRFDVRRRRGGDRSRRTPTRWTRRRCARFATPGYDRLSMGAQSFDPTVLASLERLHQPASVRARVLRRARGGLRQHQPRPDLRHRGRDDRVVGAHGARDDRARARARVGVRAHDRARDRRSDGRWPPGSDRRPTPTCRPTCSSWRASCSATPATATTRSRTGRSPASSAATTLGTGSGGPTLGLGAGAHAYRDDVRWWNIRPPEAYMDRVEAGELPIGGERVARSLRRLPRRGVPEAADPGGVPASWFEPERYEAFVESGLLDDAFGQLVPTERGMLLLNELVLGLTA